jgi:hypothetical protein
MGVVVNALAVAWLAFETVNIAWPRESLAPPGAPDYQVWAAPLVLALIGALGWAISCWPGLRPGWTPRVARIRGERGPLLRFLLA